jgi:hypothetical protein
MDEKIKKAERWCQSLWQWIPSGLATIVTWTLFATAVRHEYIIITTEKHVILMEI